MDKIIILLLLLCQLLACNSQSWQEIRVVASEPSSVQDYRRAAEVLGDRLHSAKVGYESVRYIEAEEQIVIVLSAGVDQEATLEALTSHVSVGFWPIYWTRDKESAALQTIIAKAQQEVPDLKDIRFLAPTERLNQPAIFAIVANEDVMGRAITEFRKVLPVNIRPMWGAQANIEGPDQSICYGLYLLKADSLGRAPINQQHIARAAMFIDEQAAAPMLDLEFDEEGAMLWGEMTKKAAYANNKSVAITLEDRVTFAPRVREPIYNGKSVLTGYFTVMDLDRIATILNGSSLPMPLTVLSIEPLKE